MSGVPLPTIGETNWGPDLNNALTFLDNEATDAQATADAAQSTATGAAGTAASAQTTANTALTNAATAQTTANTAITNAATAQSTATSAGSAASAAQSTANTAIANAAAAQATANAAVAKNTLVVNVQDHGAVGNGTTDDTAAIQSAINFIGSNGGIVFFPATTASYFLNSSPLALATAGTILMGSGAENTKLTIGSSFIGTAAIEITAYNCQVREMSINGASSTTTSNPICNAIEITGVRRPTVDHCSFFNINGWAIEAISTTTSSTSNVFSSIFSNLRINSCAGGIHIFGNTTQGFAVNSFMQNVHVASGGVATGSSANLDGIRVHDAWDVLAENIISWQISGTGSSYHIQGNCAASFIKNLDTLGPNGGPSVLIEDSPAGSPQNVQIDGGVIQQGSIGLRVTGAAHQLHFMQLRFISNQTHGMSIEGTGSPVHVTDVFFASDGAGATGTNYDVNWTGSSVGYLNGCYFASPIVTTGNPGVQQSVNTTAGANVVVHLCTFNGSGSLTTNWFTNLPAGVLEIGSGTLNFITPVTFAANATNALTMTGKAAGQRLIGVNGFDTTSTLYAGGIVGDSNDRIRVMAGGDIHFGPGNASRDATFERINTAELGSPDSDFALTLAGKGYRVKEGSNAKMGTAVLAAGTNTVANSSVTSTSRIFLTSQVDGGTPGFLRVSTRSAGTSFTITSSSTTDTSTVAYILFEPS